MAAVTRFWAMEHGFGMIIAIAIAHVGRVAVKRAPTSLAKALEELDHLFDSPSIALLGEGPAHRAHLRHFVDAGRAFALGLGIPDSGTSARMRVAGAKLGIEPRHVEATVDAFHYLQLLRLRVQDAAIGHASANRLDPDTLNEVDQRMLKESFRQARKLQQRLTQTFQA